MQQRYQSEVPFYYDKPLEIHGIHARKKVSEFTGNHLWYYHSFYVQLLVV